VPPVRVKQAIPVKPSACRKCGQALHGEDPQPRRHQVAEIPPVNGKQIPGAARADTAEEACQAGLEDLRKALGW
jgi:hypothetical protein